MKVSTDGVLRRLLNFGGLQDGETFVYKDKVYLRAGEFGVELETGITICLDRDWAVHKIDLIAIVEKK